MGPARSRAVMMPAVAPRPALHSDFINHGELPVFQALQFAGRFGANGKLEISLRADAYPARVYAVMLQSQFVVVFV
jgi:hypothetical protein